MLIIRSEMCRYCTMSCVLWQVCLCERTLNSCYAASWVAMLINKAHSEPMEENDRTGCRVISSNQR